MKSKQELKLLFENGDKPVQEDFWEWQESYWHKDEKIAMEKISGLEDGLPTPNKIYAEIDEDGKASLQSYFKKELFIKEDTLNIPDNFAPDMKLTYVEMPNSVTVTAVIMESINKGNGINPDVIGAISSNRKFALVYKGEIVAQGSRYDKAYQKPLIDLKRVSTNAKKVEEILKDLLYERIYLKYEGQFKIKFHHHFDGEILIKQKRGEDILELFGAHNHDVIGTKFK